MKDLQQHLAALRRALKKAQAKPAPADVIARYECEIARVQRLVAEGGPTDRNPVGTVPEAEYTRDSLLALVLKRYLPGNVDLDAPATIWMPPLPLLLAVVPSGLSAEEAARREAEAVDRIIHTWARITAARWKLHGTEDAALTRLARVWCKGDREECRRRLAFRGLCDAAASATRPQRVRVGKERWVRDVRGEIAEIAPVEQHELAYLGWLAQKALRLATDRLLREAPVVDDGEFDEGGWGGPVVVWPRDPDTGREAEFADPDATPPDEALIEKEDAEERRRAAREQLDRGRALLTPTQLRIHNALLDHMTRTGADYPEARKVIARRIAKGTCPDDIRRAETRVDQVLSKLCLRGLGDERGQER